VVTNTNNNVNGIKTANASSDTARIAVDVLIIYQISFYDENLDYVVTVNAANGSVDLSSISNTSNPWYEANSTLPLTANYNLISNVRFYAAPNVQEISYQTHLNNIRNNPNGKYILLNSIDLNETGAGFGSEGWIPIGDYSNKFTGIFNGNFNNITNLWINKTNDYIGFFTYIENAAIRNLEVRTTEDKEIRGFNFVGGIAGFISHSNITNSCFTGNISSNDNGGGIAGFAQDSNITNSCFAGNISSNNYGGGIIGSAGYSSITNSYSTGNISGDDTVGGIAGYAQDSNITNSYSIGSVNGNQYIGGIAGFADYSSITNSYSIGSVNGKRYIGGIAGFANDATIRNDAAINPSVTGETDVNRIVGFFRNNIIISNNFALNTMVGGAKYNGITNSFSNSGNARYHGTDKTQIELKTQATYFDAVNGDGLGGLGFKFGDDDDNPWKIDPNKNNGYPYLYWQDIR
jgi:hypothetical protein